MCAGAAPMRHRSKRRPEDDRADAKAAQVRRKSVRWPTTSRASNGSGRVCLANQEQCVKGSAAEDREEWRDTTGNSDLRAKASRRQGRTGSTRKRGTVSRRHPCSPRCCWGSDISGRSRLELSLNVHPYSGCHQASIGPAADDRSSKLCCKVVPFQQPRPWHPQKSRRRLTPLASRDRAGVRYASPAA